MEYKKALDIAERVKAQLAPHCKRIEIAGSIRRKKAEVKDIEIVAIPKPYDIGLFHSGIATVIYDWPSVKGKLPCKYTQRMLPEGIKLDLFFATEATWGMVYAIRTGSANFSQKMAYRWSKKGYKSSGNYLSRLDGGFCELRGYDFSFSEEKELFSFLGMPYIEPEFRM